MVRQIIHQLYLEKQCTQIHLLKYCETNVQMVSFGGFGLKNIKDILPEIEGVTWVFAPPNPAPQRKDFVYIEDVPYRDLIAGSDVVLSKAGYGICTETARSGCHVILLERNNFPEAKSLEHFVRNRGGIVLPDLRSEPQKFRKQIQSI